MIAYVVNLKLWIIKKFALCNNQSIIKYKASSMYVIKTCRKILTHNIVLVTKKENELLKRNENDSVLK
jgi:hypothetical protein